MNDLSEGPGLQATMALQFVERDGRIFMIFEAGLGERLIEVAVIEPGKHRLSGRIRSLKGCVGRTDALEAAGLRE